MPLRLITSGACAHGPLGSSFSLTCLRFARIIYIDQERKQLHVQWYEHSSKTYLAEISDPQELFLCPLCGDIDLLAMQALGKVIVHASRPDPGRRLKPLEFFCEFVDPVIYILALLY